MADMRSILESLSPEQKAQLGIDINMGQQPTQPEVYPPTGAYSQDEIGKQMAQSTADAMGPSTPDSNLAMAQQAPEAYNVMSGAMQSVPGVQAPSMPGPVQPGGMAAPAIPAAPEQVMAAVQQQTAADAHQKAIRVLAAQQGQEASDRAASVQAKSDADATKVAEDSQDSSWGPKISQAIAIMLGAYSQGLTGSKTNPAIDAIDKELNRQAAAKKYTDQQKLHLADQAYKQAQLQLNEKKNTVDSMAALKKIEQADQEIALKRMEIESKLKDKQALMGTTFTKEQLATIPADVREKLNLVRLPNGNFGSAVSSKQSNDLADLNTNTDSALLSANKLMDKIDYFGNNPAKKVLDREALGEVRGYAQALVGAMRLPYVGPGAFTDREQNLLKDIIGDPTKIFSIDTANKAALGTVMDKLKFYRRSAMRSGGIDLPLSHNEEKLQEYKKVHPNLTEGQMIHNLKATGQWDSNAD